MWYQPANVNDRLEVTSSRSDLSAANQLISVIDRIALYLPESILKKRSVLWQRANQKSVPVQEISGSWQSALWGNSAGTRQPDPANFFTSNWEYTI